MILQSEKQASNKKIYIFVSLNGFKYTTIVKIYQVALAGIP